MIQHVKNNRTAVSQADQHAGAPRWRSTSQGCLPTFFMNASKIEPSLSRAPVSEHERNELLRPAAVLRIAGKRAH